MGKTIAIIGASKNPEKFGNKAVKAYKKMGTDDIDTMRDTEK